MVEGFTLWFTGLPCSGKSTLARMVEEELRERGLRVQVLDGDEVRQSLTRDLGFSREDRNENIRRVAYVCKLLSQNGVVAIAAFVSPYREARDAAREQIQRFVEIYVRCPVAICSQRDVKGHYQKAMRGEIKNFTGVSDPYEEPLNPEIVVDTDLEAPNESAAKIVRWLEENGYLLPANELHLSQLAVYSRAEETLIERQLKALGYIE